MNTEILKQDYSPSPPHRSNTHE